MVKAHSRRPNVLTQALEEASVAAHDADPSRLQGCRRGFYFNTMGLMCVSDGFFLLRLLNFVCVDISSDSLLGLFGSATASGLPGSNIIGFGWLDSRMFSQSSLKLRQAGEGQTNNYFHVSAGWATEGHQSCP